jgi:choline-sulfatase
MSDEHRPDVIGYAGNMVVRAPTLDTLAADSVVFNNAYSDMLACGCVHQYKNITQIA